MNLTRNNKNQVGQKVNKLFLKFILENLC